ncbi:MAG TPA: hypothetical protein VNZ22_06880, partial [Bacillota bacterium]|nr:hypothetical protein [Bacillota bacterium]
NLFMPEVYVRESPSGRGECIELSWEKFGLLVGRSNFTTAFQPWYITNAAPGIYVFHDRDEMEQ